MGPNSTKSYCKSSQKPIQKQAKDSHSKQRKMQVQETRKVWTMIQGTLLNEMQWSTALQRTVDALQSVN